MRRYLWLCGALAFLLCGCTGGSSDNTSRPTTRKSPSPSATPSVPTVSNPLDLNDYDASPCDLLDAAELAPLELGKGARGDESASGGCFYIGEAGNRSLLLRLYPDNSRLADAYHLDDDDYQVFEPLEIRGMPAVKEARPKDKPENTTCTVIVGVADDQSVVLHYDPEREVRPTDAEATCAKVVRAAEAVLRRLGA